MSILLFIMVVYFNYLKKTLHQNRNTLFSIQKGSKNWDLARFVRQITKRRMMERAYIISASNAIPEYIISHF